MNRKIMIPALILAAAVSTAGGLAYAKQSGACLSDDRRQANSPPPTMKMYTILSRP